MTAVSIIVSETYIDQTGHSIEWRTHLASQGRGLHCRMAVESISSLLLPWRPLQDGEQPTCRDCRAPS